MRTSQEIGKFAPALVKAQAMIGAVTKDKTAKIESNKGSYEYKFADFASVVETLKEALRSNGLAMIQGASQSEGGITVITRVLHESGEWGETDIFIPVSVQNAQAVGSALTYGKRYGAQSFMFLPSEDDDGKKATEEAPRPNTAKQVAKDVFAGLDLEEQKFLLGHATWLTAGHEEGKLGEDLDHYIKSQKLDNDEELALWSLLPAPVRTSINGFRRATKDVPQ